MKTLPEDCKWFPFSDEPLILSTNYAPRFSDPQVILPEQACDGKWHMFFHSLIGIHHFTSDSGIGWDPQHVIEFRGHSPYIYCEGDYYYLIYEKHRKDIPFLKSGQNIFNYSTDSRFEMIVSTDLVTWSKPRLILEAKDVPYAGDYLPSPRISRPQLVRVGTQYRLYFGASHLILPDTGQKVSRYFGYAVSQDIQGPYKIEKSAKPLFEPEPDDKWTNLGVGSIRVVPYAEKYYAFRCGAYFNPDENKTSTALMVLVSDDGTNFRKALEKPLLVPAEKGWADCYITACDCHYREEEKCWYCYFSALGHGEKVIKTESIGLLIGSGNTVRSRISEQRDHGFFSI